MRVALWGKWIDYNLTFEKKGGWKLTTVYLVQNLEREQQITPKTTKFTPKVWFNEIGNQNKMEKIYKANRLTKWWLLASLRMQNRIQIFIHFFYTWMGKGAALCQWSIHTEFYQWEISRWKQSFGDHTGQQGISWLEANAYILNV